MSFQDLRSKHMPVMVAVSIMVVVCFVHSLPVLFPTKGNLDEARMDFAQRLELITYDWRVKEALKYNPTVSPNLGFVRVSDASIRIVMSGLLGYEFGLYWPRQVYARMVNELATNGVKAIAFDVMMAERRVDQGVVELPDGSKMSSDEYFAEEIEHAGNVVLAANKGAVPIPLFRDKAYSVADISADKDPDGVLRRVRAFKDYRFWHPALEVLAAHTDVDLDKAELLKDFKPGKDSPKADYLRLTKKGKSDEPIMFPVLRGNLFSPKQIYTELGLAIPKDTPRLAPMYDDARVWHMGIQLGAMQLGLDLDKAEIDLPHRRITLRGDDGMQRVIPVDANGYFLVDWSLRPTDAARFKVEDISTLLVAYNDRRQPPASDNADKDAGGDKSKTEEEKLTWKDRLVVVGSTATGNDLTDVGATPMEKDTFLVSKHWNVANSVIMGRFISKSPYWLDLVLILVVGVYTCTLTWKVKSTAMASLAVCSIAALYVAGTVWAFVSYRYWMPVVMPVIGGGLVPHLTMVTYRAVFEQREKKRTRQMFSKLVSPDVVNEIMGMERISMGGARLPVTVFFSDVRGFTEFTDSMQAMAEEYVRKHGLTGREADAYFDQQAEETLKTVNLYLSLIADTIKAHKGTLDKYIGDCVMAFWGAPIPNERHAVDCVETAIDAQLAMYRANVERAADNERIQLENEKRVAAGEDPLPLHAVLALGSGINTGRVTVGMMGSENHIYSYTVFGREVNIASRLEGVSGRGRIIISESTLAGLRQHKPELAGKCVELPPVHVKGVKSDIKIFEVPWRPADAPAAPTPGQAGTATATPLPS